MSTLLEDDLVHHHHRPLHTARRAHIARCCYVTPFRALCAAVKSVLPRRLDEPTGAWPFLLDLLLGIIVPLGASKEQISLIQTKTLGTENFARPQGMCPICLGEYCAGEDIRILQCSHTFHVECVDPWLERRNLCPVCKSDGC